MYFEMHCIKNNFEKPSWTCKLKFFAHYNAVNFLLKWFGDVNKLIKTVSFQTEKKNN